MDIGHLSHPVYGAPELATALVDNPAEYLPIVSFPNSLLLMPACLCTRMCLKLLLHCPQQQQGTAHAHAPPLSIPLPLSPPARPPALQFEQAAKQESQRIQNLMEDGSDPDVKDVQVSGGGCCWQRRGGL